MNSTHPVFDALVHSLAQATQLPPAEITAQLGRPPKADMGDYAFPCFAYGKKNKIAPPAAAAQLAEKLKGDPALAVTIESAEPAGPFLNIRVKPGALNASIINWVLN